MNAAQGSPGALRRAAHWLLPEGAIEAVRRRGTRSGHAEHVALPGWPEADADAGGAAGEAAWDDAAVARAMARDFPAFVEACAGTAPLDLAHEAAGAGLHSVALHNTYLSFGYVLARAALGRDRLSVLDWGGGLGHYAVLARALMPDLALDYTVKDLPAFCREGARLLPGTRFVDDDSWRDRTFDLVFASGALQYARDWRGVVADLAAVTAGHLCVTRLPLFADTPATVVRQDARPHGIDAEFTGWFLNRGEFVSAVGLHGLELRREFWVAEHPVVSGIAETPDVRGFLFERSDAGAVTAPGEPRGGEGR